jgi:hypothetical protein
MIPAERWRNPLMHTRYRIIMVNRTFLENHGVAEADIIGNPCRQVVRACARESCPLQHNETPPISKGTTRRTQVVGGDKHLEIITSPGRSKLSIFGRPAERGRR